MAEANLVQAVREQFPQAVIGFHSYLGDETILVRRENILEVLRLLKEQHQFGMLADLSAADYAGQIPRFEVVYHLNSIERNVRVRVKVPVGEGEEIDSATPLWPIANWLERETWDMFGIHFRNHPDLRRLLMYDEFEGHPLRKDYPINKRQPRIKARK